jgi:hypothetical protein
MARHVDADRAETADLRLAVTRAEQANNLPLETIPEHPASILASH